jgi:MoxR-like ATPase
VGFDLSTVPEHDRARVAALIPDPLIAKEYVHRSVRGFEDFDIFDVAIENRSNIMLVGPTGSAKTTAFRAYAAARGLPFALVECNAAMDPGTILGRTTIVEGGVAWVDGDMTLVVRYGGVVLIDEINMAHPRITAAFHQLLAVTRRMSVPEAGETIIAGRGGLGEPQLCLLCSAMNPQYQGVTRLNEALLNRFPVNLPWDYDRNVEEQLVASSRLLDTAQTIRDLEDITTPCPTNALQEFEMHVAQFNMDMASYLFVNRFAPGEQPAIARALEANAVAIATEIELAAEEEAS